MGSYYDLVYGVLLYAIDTTFWAYSIKLGLPFWRAGIIWTLGSLIICVLVGMFYKESPSLLNWIGIILAFIAVIFVEL